MGDIILDNLFIYSICKILFNEKEFQLFIIQERLLIILFVV